MKNINVPNTSEYINRFFDYLRNRLNGKILDSEKVFSKIGLCGLYVFGILGLIFSVAAKVRFGIPFGEMLVAIVLFIIISVVLHYVAFMMLPALDKLIQNAPTRLSSANVLSVAALFVGAFGFLALICGTYAAFFVEKGYVMQTQVGTPSCFFAGLFTFVFCEYWMALLLEPKALNVEIVEKTSVGEEFIGLTSFFAKGCLKLVPVIFGMAVIFAVILLACILFSSSISFNQIGVLLYLLSSAFLPLLMYVVFLSYYLTLDIIIAILGLPARLDRIAAKEK